MREVNVLGCTRTASLAFSLLLAAHAAAEPDAPAAAAGEPAAGLEDVSGTWAPDGKTSGSQVLSLYRHQPADSAAAAPNSVYVREVDGSPCGHCWLVPSYDYDSRRLQARRRGTRYR